MGHRIFVIIEKDKNHTIFEVRKLTFIHNRDKYDTLISVLKPKFRQFNNNFAILIRYNLEKNYT